MGVAGAGQAWGWLGLLGLAGLGSPGLYYEEIGSNRQKYTMNVWRWLPGSSFLIISEYFALYLQKYPQET